MVRDRPTLTVVAHDLHGGGGMERSLGELIGRAVKDYRVQVVSVTLPEHLAPLVTWHRIRVPRKPAPLKVLAFFVVAGWRLRRLPSDLVHVTGAIVPNRADVAVVHYLHAARSREQLLEGLRDVGRLRRLNALVQRALALTLERWCYRAGRTAVMAAVSGGVADEVRQHYPGVRVHVVSNGVDPVLCTEQDREDARGRLKIAAGHVLFLFVGGHWGHKGLGRVSRALALLSSEEQARARLVVVGEGDRKRFSALARELGVSHAVSFAGRADPAPYYCAADALVLPSTYETFSLVCHEAAAAGLCVIATPVHGVRELVEHEATGLLTDLQPESIADGMRFVLHRPEEAKALGAAARSRVAPLTWDQNYSRLSDLYMAALIRRQLP